MVRGTHSETSRIQWFWEPIQMSMVKYLLAKQTFILWHKLWRRFIQRYTGWAWKTYNNLVIWTMSFVLLTVIVVFNFGEYLKHDTFLIFERIMIFIFVIIFLLTVTDAHIDRVWLLSLYTVDFFMYYTHVTITNYVLTYLLTVHKFADFS